MDPSPSPLCPLERSTSKIEYVDQILELKEVLQDHLFVSLHVLARNSHENFYLSAKQQPFTLGVWSTSGQVQNLADGFSMDYTQVRSKKIEIKLIFLFLNLQLAC